MFGKGGGWGRHILCPDLSRPGATKSAHLQIGPRNHLHRTQPPSPNSPPPAPSKGAERGFFALAADGRPPPTRHPHLIGRVARTSGVWRGAVGVVGETSPMPPPGRLGAPGDLVELIVSLPRSVGGGAPGSRVACCLGSAPCRLRR